MPDWRSATFHRGRMALLFMLLGAAPGCSGGGEEPYTERIENGVRVLSYRENLPPETNPLEVGDPVTYGSGQSEDTYLLAFASFVGRLEDGTVFVNDLMSGRIHRFTAEGTWLGAFGRKGPGPMEFGTGYTAYVMDGDVYVWVSSNMRLLHFSPEGEYLGGQSSTVGIYSAPIPAGEIGESPYLTLYGSRTMPGIGVTSSPWRLGLFRVDASLSQRDTLYYEQGLAEGMWFGNRYTLQPFEPLLPPSALGRGTPFAVADRKRYRIDLLPVTDGTPIAVELRVEGPVVTAEEQEEEMESLSRYGEEAVRRQIHFPERKPAIRWMIWDGSRRLWVEDRVPPEVFTEGRHYNVFDAGGYWLLSQELPDRPAAIYADGYYLNTQNEAGEPVVRFFPLTERPPR